MTAAEEHLAKEAEWTVRDNDGIDHRAVRQSNGSFTWVITACDWWHTHNVAGEKAPVRIDREPNCLACTVIDVAHAHQHCKHCGVSARQHADAQTHSFEAA